VTATLLLAAIVSGSASGCAAGPRVVLVRPVVWVDGAPSDLIRIGPGVKGRVYVYEDGAWSLSKNEVEIPEGWMAAPPPPAGDDGGK